MKSLLMDLTNYIITENKDCLLSNGPPKKLLKTKFGALIKKLLGAIIVVPYIHRYDNKKYIMFSGSVQLF